MAIKRPWAFWRRVQYATGFFVLLVLISVGTFLALYEDTSNCFDGLQNGLERGVDCGGACVRICSIDVEQPKILWTKSFEISEGQYNTVAYVENVNDIASVENLQYTFQLFNNGTLVAERKGQTVLPPDSVYPIFEGRIKVDGNIVTDTKLIIEPIDIWQPATAGREQFKISDIVLTNVDVRPRLDALIENTELTSAAEVEVVATLFNDLGEPVTASETYVDVIDARSKSSIVFTWPKSIAKTVRSCSIPSDVVMGIDLSGSMNNDGDNPPEPVTAAKNAAIKFVERLNDEDQVALVTFATNARTDITLTKNHQSAIEKIKNLAVSSEEESGFTNTVAALEAMKAELDSERHSGNARKAAILLTDGLPTGTEKTSDLLLKVESLTQAIVDNGTTLYVIGLGKNVDQDFIRRLTPESEFSFFAPSGSDLDSIYQNITGALCEVGTTKIDVIAKTKTNFTPLR